MAHLGEPARIHYWRTSAGTEVDLLAELGNARLAAIEIKASQTPTRHMAKAISTLRADLGDTIDERAWVVHTGPETVPLGHHVTALPWHAL